MTVTAEDILTGLRPWVEAESPTRETQAVNRVMDLVAADYRGIGFAVERIPGRDGLADHLRATAPWGGEGPGILVLCHVDTVHGVGAMGPAFRREGDRVYGPGVLDMKGGGFLAFTALRLMAEEGTGGLQVRVLITGDEEVGSPTARALIEAEGERARFVLVPEPARNGGRIVTGRRGVGRYGVTVHGRAAHSGIAHAEGRSAIAEMARQVLKIEAMTDYDRGVTLNVGRIEGGTTDNTVPEWCRARVDLRMDDAGLAAEFDAALKALAPLADGFEIEVQGGITRPPWRKTPAIQALFAHAQGLAAEIGFDLKDIHTGGGSDGSFLAARLPVLDGLGVDGAGAHTLEEHLYVSSLVPRMRLLKRLMETLA
ncbi:MAG: M20 family peptidase [Alphaproteobacteria bacterium]|nr:MAG: M20 family peptidase [Alphaproteobacteria bacterium]